MMMKLMVIIGEETNNVSEVKFDYW